MSVPHSRPSVDAAFSPIENEAPLRWLRRLHLAPDDGLAPAGAHWAWRC
jgi:hypothetical protein